MTSPQQPQPQPQPERGPHDTGAHEQPMPAAPPMPPTAPHPPQGQPPQMPPAQEQPGQQQSGQQPAPGQPAPAREPGTMTLQAQSAPQQPAPAKEAGTMMLQAQGQGPAPAQGQAPQGQDRNGQAPAPQPQGQAPAQPPPGRGAGTMTLQAQQQHPEPRPLAAHGPGKDAGTMMLQGPPQAPAPAPAPAQPQAQPQAPAPAQAQAQPQAPQPPAPPHPQQAYAGAGGYVSSIPVRPTHLGNALLSEWIKIRSVRSTMWTLGVMIVLIVGIGLLTAAVIAGHSDSLGPDSALSFGTFGMMMGLFPLITLGVLVISSEYSTGMIRTTLTACPARGRILTAKAIVFFALSFVITLVCTTVVAIAQNAMLGDMAESTPTGAAWFKATVGVSLFAAMIGLLSLAVGALLRHSAGAITLMTGVYLLPLVLAIFMQADSLKDIQTWLLEYALPSQLNAMYDAALTSSGPSGWEPLWIVTGLTAVALGSAYAVINKRDV
ncbi:ABC transporter permease subunit [Streptomyces tubercidicus]|uniref:ABC transporter permease subunit n=1 Tax=Streptomyces tubercidicus TaxID=47759 RepID=UPI00378AE1D6